MKLIVSQTSGQARALRGLHSLAVGIAICQQSRGKRHPFWLLYALELWKFGSLRVSLHGPLSSKNKLQKLRSVMQLRRS